MNLLANILIGLIALEHVWFLILEMFLWQKPIALRAFGMTAEAASSSAVLAANQGLYNGFLAAGLAWGLATSDAERSLPIKSFFLGCVFLAGAFGGCTANRRIWVLQALPAFVAMVLLGLSRAGGGR